MSKFLNLKFDKGLPKQIRLKHLYFSIYWVIGILIFIFRIDNIIIQNLKLNSSAPIYVVPVLYLFCLFILIKNQKWYYTIAFVFYPLLLFFWFIPKWILVKWKIYIFLYYLNFLVQVLIKFKRFIFITFTLILCTIILVATNFIWIKMFYILLVSYIYYLFLKIFIKSFFKPTQFLEPKNINSFHKYISDENPENSALIKDLENQKEDEKLNDEQKSDKKKLRLIRTQYVLEYLSQSLSGFRSERAYIMLCIFQLILYFTMTLSYFTFLNFELFSISPNSFIVTFQPSIFDFFYYTLKSVTFSNIDSIKPISVIARIIEISSFLILGIFLLIIVVSQFFSLKKQKFTEEINLGIKACQTQSSLITIHLSNKYSTDLKSTDVIISNDDFIKNMKKFFEQIF